MKTSKSTQALRWFFDRFYGFKRSILTIPQIIIGYILYLLEYKNRNLCIVKGHKNILSDLKITDSFDVLIDMTPSLKDPLFQDISSQLLAISQIKSFGYYWEQNRLREEALIFAKEFNNLSHNSTIRAEPVLEAFYTSNLFIKRHAQGRRVYLIDEEALEGLPLSHFREDACLWLVNDSRRGFYESSSILSLSACGCSLHERLALAKLSDGYVGSNKLLEACAPTLATLEGIIHERD